MNVMDFGMLTRWWRLVMMPSVHSSKLLVTLGSELVQLRGPLFAATDLFYLRMDGLSIRPTLFQQTKCVRLSGTVKRLALFCTFSQCR